MTDARRALLGALIDHAALFPPASMGMEQAVEEDRRARSDRYAWMLARFVCPASRLGELEQALGGWDGAPPLSVVLDGVHPSDEASWSEALEADAAEVAAAGGAGAPVAALELRLPSPRPGSSALLAAQTVLRPLRAEIYLELLPGERWPDTLPAAIGDLAAVGARAKLRCGGEGPDAFPPVALVALVLASCRDTGVVLKATAGLHHPIRHRDPATGFSMHGFLNLLAAASFAAAQNMRPGGLERVLAEEDPQAFEVGADALRVGRQRASAVEIAAARRHLFASYGSCSWREPVEDLQALGVLE
ncbi:MAG TPA: hypothetical protein VE270_06580 [Thermoleophilaceae bacterium]|nr:hypothetical protein [Thermoleophilaceae bacterium]